MHPTQAPLQTHPAGRRELEARKLLVKFASEPESFNSHRRRENTTDDDRQRGRRQTFACDTKHNLNPNLGAPAPTLGAWRPAIARRCLHLHDVRRMRCEERSASRLKKLDSPAGMFGGMFSCLVSALRSACLVRWQASPSRCSSSGCCRWRSRSSAKSGTVQEYRRIWQPIGKAGADGMRAAKEVEYWGFVAIIGPRPDKIRVIVRRVGTGNITFWSVMRGSKILPDGRPATCAGQSRRAIECNQKAAQRRRFDVLAFQLTEGLAEQGLRPQARLHPTMIR